MARCGCLWIPDFPVWVAVTADPKLRFAPVVVHRGGRVVAVSAVAREHGVRRGWSVARILSLVPHTVALAQDGAAGAFAWEQVLSALYELTPRIEPVHEGLAFFEVPTRLDGRQAIARHVLQWEAHGGAGRNRALAELAAYSAPCGRVQSVPVRSERDFLKKVPITLLNEAGVTTHTIERLQWFGLRNVDALWALSRRQLNEQFGERKAGEDGARLLRFARAGTNVGTATTKTATGAGTATAEPPIPAYVPPPLIEERLVFEQAATQPCEWEAALDEVLQRACGELNGRRAGSLSIAVETGSGRRAQSRLLREPIGTPRSLREPARAIIGSLLDNGNDDPNTIEVSAVEVSAVEVRLGNLTDPARQGELFAPASHHPPHGGTAALPEVLRGLEARYAGVVRRIRARDLHSPLPEERFALVPVFEATQAAKPERRTRPPKLTRHQVPRPKAARSR